MSNIVARELRKDEVEMGLQIRNEIFSPITLEEWKKGEEKTASVALDEENMIGCIPLYLREFKLGKDIHIQTAFENAVGTKEAYRGQGIGSEMIHAAGEFLKEKADALYVYRGGERTKAYHFYNKTGHYDLHYMREYVCNTTNQSMDYKVEFFSGTKEIINNQTQLLKAFEDTYGNHGGYPKRHSHYWETAFESTYFKTKSTNIYFFSLKEKGRILAYLIAGQEGENTRAVKRNEKFYILEMAAIGQSEEEMKKVIEAANSFADHKKMGPLYLIAGDQHPFKNLLEKLHFEQNQRGIQIMSYSYDSSALFYKIWKQRFNLQGIELKVWTPEQDFILLEAKGKQSKTVTIEMKEETLTRWLMGRIDFCSRVKEGTITVMNGNDQIVEEIAKGIPCYQWEYHHLDFI